GFYSRLFLCLFDCSLCSGKAGNRNTERGAGNVIKADFVAELDRGRVAAVLTADAAVKGRAGSLTEFNSHLHQSADALLVKLRERIVFVNLLVIVSIEELTGVITAEAEGHLGKVV